MQVHRHSTVLACAICERTLLLGERALRYRLAGEAHAVCELCAEEAEQLGWRREGDPAPPPVAVRRDRSRGLFGGLRRKGRDERPAPRPVLPEGLPGEPAPAPGDPALVAHEGVAAFNSSQYRRTVSGISKSLGDPLVSVVPLSGSRPDVVVTVAWELSWYQYRVDATGGMIRLEGRGDDPDDLDERWRRWNAHLASDGRLAIAS
jgi:hypothetical protein